MKTKPKVQKTYRLKERTVKLIEWIAEKSGFGAQAETIDMWAEEWAGRKENETPAWWDGEDGSEKKSRAAREVFSDDVPDEVLKARGKRILARPEMQVPYTEAQLMGMGVKKGSEIKSPAKKPVATAGKQGGKTFIMGTGQIEDLAGQRVGRAPLPRPGEK